jgi:competence protein ComEC
MPVNAWGEAPFAALLLSLVLGIVSARVIHSYVFALLMLAGSCLIAAAIAAFRKDRPTLALFSGLAAISLGGMTLALARRDAYPASDLRALLPAAFPLEQPLLFEGCVVEEVTQYDNESVTNVEFHGYQRGNFWTACRGRGLIEVPAVPGADEQIPGADIRRGDRIRGWATWHLPRNYQNPGARDRIGALALQDVYLIGRVKSPRLLEVIPQDCSHTWSRLVARVRKGLLQNLAAPPTPAAKQPAAILASLLVGDYTGLSNETREAFQNNGTYHVLVVSGLHIGSIAWVLLRILRTLRCPIAVSRCLVAFGIFFYSSMVGFQASVTRSLWMFLLILAGQLMVRRASPANLTFASAFLLLCVCPDWLRDIGFQLSFISVIAICLSALPVIQNALEPLLRPLQFAGEAGKVFVNRGRFHRWGRQLRVRAELIAEAGADRFWPQDQQIWLAAVRIIAKVGMALGSSLIVTISIQFWLEPLLAYHFNRLAWIAPLANLIIVPISSLILMTAAVASLAAAVPAIQSTSFEVAARMAGVFLEIARYLSDIPGAWQRCPTPDLSWVLAGLSAMFAWSFLKWRRPWLPCLSVLLILAILAVGRRPDGVSDRPKIAGTQLKSPFSLTFLDVGEGDSIVLRFPDGVAWVLDAGGAGPATSNSDAARALDVGEAVVSRYLWFCWETKLERLLLSHPDRDHAGGVASLMKNFRFRRFDYAPSSGETILTRILETSRSRGMAAHAAKAGDRETHAGVLVSVLNPTNDGLHHTTNENSLVLQLTHGRFTALLTGDLEKSGEADFLARNPDMRSMLLKVAHHGSRSSTSADFLRRVRPIWAIVSVGRGNAFGHPSPDVISRLRSQGVRPLLTTEQGAITFETDGEHYALASFAHGVLEQGILPQ